MNSADNEQNPVSLCVHSDPASRAVLVASNSLPKKIRAGFVFFFLSCGLLNVTCAVSYCSRIAPRHPFPWT